MKQINILCILIGLLLLVGCSTSVKPVADSVTREIPSSVKAGEEFTINYHIGIDSGQKFYIFEDAIPKSFEIKDCEHDSANNIKNVVYIKPKSETISCKIIASDVKGDYSLKGVFVMDNTDVPVPMTGISDIKVK